MKEFANQISDVIAKLQKIIIQNTITLDDTVRSEVYSKFQSIKYKIVSAETFKNDTAIVNATAYYSPIDNTINILDYGNTKIKTISLLHEILHALTNVPINFNILNKTIDGFKATNSFKFDNSILITCRGRGVNEGATEYFAEKFLNIQSTNCYPFEVHIFSLLCEECGFEKLKNAYFGHNIEELKNIINDTFHLKSDHLVDDLILNLDIYGVIYGKDTKLFAHLPLIKNCYADLLKMKFNKLVTENPKVTNKEDIIKLFNVEKYLSTNINKFFEQFFKSLFLDLELGKYDILLNDYTSKYGRDFTAKSSLVFADAIFNQDANFIIKNSKYYRENAIEILKQFCSENVYLKYGLEGQKVYKLDNSKFISVFLSLLHDKDTKIDLSKYDINQKYQFIGTALYNRYENAENQYLHFYPKDLIEFINSGYYECDVFFKQDAMQYIWTEIKKVNPMILTVPEFEATYNLVKQKNEQKELDKQL